MEVRLASTADLPAIVAIERESFSDPWTPSSFESLLGRDHVLFLVTLRAQQVVAFAIAYSVEGSAEIANIAVSRAARAQGVGTALLQRLLEVLAKEGVVEVWLEVRASNTTARTLYERHGFSAVGQRRNYYVRPVEDAVVMQRTLGGAME
jgi:ribosomal-protein-alanine N-acetyltransferase